MRAAQVFLSRDLVGLAGQKVGSRDPCMGEVGTYRIRVR